MTTFSIEKLNVIVSWNLGKRGLDLAWTSRRFPQGFRLESKARRRILCEIPVAWTVTNVSHNGAVVFQVQAANSSAPRFFRAVTK
ncbi:MAG: hypothetical protein HY735_38685 [Verrucomicrobia bacterium]|nr:hypothetical protein [Verrucomicrobiota bacterium]